LTIAITVVDEKQVLNSNTVESYSLLLLTSQQSTIKAHSVFGVLYALDTLAQLVVRNANNWELAQVSITDFPRFSFRGFLHDTSRHFLSVKVLKTLIDAMAAAKLNVLHWHIVDDQSFPFVSRNLPRLSEKGAYGQLKSHMYSPADVKDIINYAMMRGVRVVPEFDTPGHVRSWGLGYPDLTTQCYTNGTQNGCTGPLNPTDPTVYILLKSLFSEINQTFYDDYIHIGGDEVGFDCWQSNPAIQAWMNTKGWTNYALLEQYYETKLINIIEQTQKHYIVWQEVFDNGIKIAPQTIIDVWKSGWQQELQTVTLNNFQSILSSPWYLNYIEDPYSWGSNWGAWEDYYLIEPLNFTGTEQQKKLVIGGEGCMWGEFSDNTNVITNTWPRAASVAERLWSAETVRDLNDAMGRIFDFTCELIRRNIPAQPAVGPSFCKYEYNM